MLYWTIVFLKIQEGVIIYLFISFIFKYEKIKMFKCQWEGFSFKSG